MRKEIDYLSEDIPIGGQKFALITIVGPNNVSQKCDVWGMKIKGVADTLEKAKSMSSRLVKADPEFDIFIVEVGKFFPLNVEPTEVEDVEYQNSQLNNLMKSYLENRQLANDKYSERKNEMMQAAIKEGRNQEELKNKEEHPIVVLQRIDTYKEKLEKLQDEIDTLKADLQVNTDKYNRYPDEARVEAESKLGKVIGNVTKVVEVPKITEDSVNKLIEELQELDSDISETNTKINACNEQHSPNMFKKLTEKLNQLTLKKSTLKEQLTNKDLVNKYINKNYENSEYTQLENNVVIKTL